jgi:antirestriction protein ArdC
VATNETDRADVYTRVTDKIIAAIEAGADTWTMPWHAAEGGGYPVNAATGQNYRGVNILNLWVTAQEKGYADPHWATFKQWQDLGKQVAKGEKSTLGVFWKRFEGNATAPVEQDADGEDARSYMVARAFSLFNACQTEGYEPIAQPIRPEHERIDSAESFFEALGADIRHGGSKAFYRPSTDQIQMPSFEAFVDPIAYYATLAHEATHWSGHGSRLDRDLKGRFGDDSYAAEELIAELGAAFVSASLQLTAEPRDDHAAYIDNWLKILKADNRAIFTAAGHAQRAADYLHAQQNREPQAKPSPDERRRSQPGPAAVQPALALF